LAELDIQLGLSPFTLRTPSHSDFRPVLTTDFFSKKVEKRFTFLFLKTIYKYRDECLTLNKGVDMGNIIKVDFKAIKINNIKKSQLKHLMEYLPELKERHKKLKELHAPKSIIDGDVRLIYACTHRLDRLKAWWYQQMTPEEKLLRAIFCPETIGM
jgi:hypothetical protein